MVAELLSYSKEADFDIREELALKIAILAEKFASNYAWYAHRLRVLLYIGKCVGVCVLAHGVCAVCTRECTCCGHFGWRNSHPITLGMLSAYVVHLIHMHT